MKKPRTNLTKGKWVFVPNENRNPEEVEQEAMEEVSTGLCLFRTDFAGRCAAVEEFTNYFPGTNKVPEGGAWVLVKHPPQCEYTVPPLSIWFAEPWPIDNERHCSHRVQIVTPRGSLGLFPREYSLIENPEKYYEFIGDGMEMKFFGNDEGVPELPLFYLRSRGISKKDAIAMLIGQIKAHGVCWIETNPETCAVFGKEWPEKSSLATVMG